MFMSLWGTIINALAIVAASLLGLVLPKMPETMHRTVIQAIGIFTCVLGAGMALKGEEPLYLVVSLAAGTLIGEAVGVERGFERAGAWLERKVGAAGSGKVGEGFVTATLIFCIGAMAILGPIESATGQGHSLLYTKSIMDGMVALILASTLGIGVIFSAPAVFVYQGAIALAAFWFAGRFSPGALALTVREISAVGGVMIVGVGLNLLEIKKIRVANMLPALVVMALLMALLR
ncbi:DUF554 domain-containing protein [Gorillibacterium sp. sgz500922]|uniref:DUF554 domain-containing protein n=1 Tax=Gorillibacterium sp. sgz500922 TaxID=3446694 RepID=UPI003F667FC5